MCRKLKHDINAAKNFDILTISLGVLYYFNGPSKFIFGSVYPVKFLDFTKSFFLYNVPVLGPLTNGNIIISSRIFNEKYYRVMILRSHKKYLRSEEMLKGGGDLNI